MAEFGYKLSSEEHGPQELVRYARRAEDTGFSFAVISDHYHPWVDRQGHSPFAWSVIGGIAQVTKDLRIGTGVTCPTIRIHPAIIAQAAGTSAAMLPGRFFLGVGSGENLNEHILADRWPPTDVRLEMLEEAIDVIRLLWAGGKQSHYGRHYTVENARLYTLPDELPPIFIAAAGSKAAKLAGRIGDGLIGVAPKPEVIETFGGAGGKGKPRYAEVHVCWGEDEAKARQTAVEWWPNIAVKGELAQELPMPAHFEQAAQMIEEGDVAQLVACGPDAAKHVGNIEKFLDAGYDHVFIHQIGPDQDGFFDFYESEVLPKLS
ncbi:MAG: TIGR03557 family F420-dependent LLM class oxidoreductase [Actinomycetota bacterium]|nr:TIGR03557 family F420-dependent LLM class oxidoreductase [Actinomycetota bacterium]